MVLKTSHFPAYAQALLGVTHPGVSLSIEAHGEDPNLFVIHSFRLNDGFPKFKGYGGAAMNKLLFVADIFAVTLTMHPRSEHCYEDGEGLDQYVLEHWLEEKGFFWQDVQTARGTIVNGMIRFPQPHTQVREDFGSSLTSHWKI